MINNIINGKLIAKKILRLIKNKVSEKFQQTNLIPKIATILINDDPISEVYIKTKIKIASDVGINTKLIHIRKTVTNNDLLNLIISLNKDSTVTAILIQLPVYKHINKNIIFQAIDYKKDVDGFGVMNIGLLNHWNPIIAPCTPQGILYILKKYLQNLIGKKAVIISRSIIVGRPMSSMLIEAGCTVTVVHSQTQNIKKECKSADILISAAGVPHLVKEDWVSNNAFVVDVGINRVCGTIVGDIDFHNVKNKALLITPVPGGVGPMTVAYLLMNTYAARKELDNL